MSDELHAVMLTAHIAFGATGLLLGSVAVLLPKFARGGWRHRWVGRAYAVAMLIQASLAIPLAWQIRSYLLLVIGVLTLFWVTGAWIALRMAVRTGRNGARIVDMAKLRLHFTFMGSSYIGAWTAFLINAGPLAENPVMFTTPQCHPLSGACSSAEPQRATAAGGLPGPWSRNLAPPDRGVGGSFARL